MMLHSGKLFIMFGYFTPIIRFFRDSAVLADWMGGAREMIDKCSQLTLSANEETDAKQKRDHYLQIVVRKSWRKEIVKY